jgi:transcription initiation factor TFIID TATA-box-binding protein
MDSLTTHPATALQAKAFTSPQSLSFPGGAGDLTPPNDGKLLQMNGNVNGNATAGAMPATPAATPAAGQGTGASGITPTLQ